MASTSRHGNDRVRRRRALRRLSGRGGAHVPPHLSKEQDIPLKAGDRVRVGTPGGGGYGDPRERDPELVRRDVAMGYYTAEEAERLFGVTPAS